MKSLTLSCCLVLSVFVAFVQASPTPCGFALTYQTAQGQTGCYDFDDLSWNYEASTTSCANRWTLTQPVTIYTDDQQLVGSIDGLVIESDADPSVSVQFAVTAGASETTFSFSSALTLYPQLTNPKAYAVASTTLTDADYSNTAYLTGLFDGKLYKATYNNSTEFAKLVSSYNMIGHSTFAGQRYPAADRIVINNTVSTIEGYFGFKLSANDSASGSSRFDIIPEPATVAVLALGSLLLRRRK